MIFINIASYDDKQIYDTIKSLWLNSDNFSAIKLGICWQSDQPLKIKLSNCDYIWLPLSEARGVGYARALAHTLYCGQNYYLTIDSHTLFSPSWDTKIIKDYQNATNRILSPVIYSAYAPGWSEYPNGKARKLIPKSEFNHFGVLRFRASNQIFSDIVYPPISCHFMFSHSQFFIDIPHDPNIFYNGEEITYTVRAFTNGWINVQPGSVYLYHKYNQKEKGHPTIWKNNKSWQLLNNPSIDRVQAICSKNPDNLGQYGKGNSRSMIELEQILGVDFTKKTVL